MKSSILNDFQTFLSNIDYRSKTFQIIFIILICICLQWCRYSHFQYERELIDKDGIVLKAVIIEASAYKSSRRIEYEYYHYSKKYNDSSKSPHKYINCKWTRSCIGDTILIKMSTSNPDYTIVLGN
jgi:hypothetical protein